MSALLTENATLQNEWGDVVQGRTSIEAALVPLMANLPAGAKLKDTPLVSHAVAPDVIVSQGTSQRSSPNDRTGANVLHTGAGTAGQPMAAGCDSNRSAFRDAETS